ncbi:MAG: carbamoyltransferase HypF [Geobacteraceae bacterium GWC2_58_44]|nr:MAG: carbamoyltransferase HypF [Geobacteraceae bacterium GWC2_58_44]HBG04749.1 carbamoyltransferase HypF [Geobacter sp.]
MRYIARIRVEIEGIVQGVGFRPFIFRLAGRHGVSGWVRNSAGGVLLEAEGTAADLAAFSLEMEREVPPLAVIASIRKREIPPTGENGFLILPSAGGENQIQIAPDGDVCAECLGELFDPGNRRYLYPFINCTNCGPRYSIITGIPYDRPLTTMAGFALCDACRAEYENPADRRFHAQPNACPVCGPRLALTEPGGREIDGDPVAMAVSLLREGRILAVKGTGGYHLALDPCNDGALREIRRRKRREEKPFALMAPSLAEVERHACCGDLERRLLCGPERPIVILPKRDGSPVSPLVAPGNGYLGMMLPATPLQQLLLRGNFSALVMTSGNLSGEPILYRDREAFQRLAGIADFFLTHDRAIEVCSDDSVIRVFQGNPLFLRRSRGYVPRSIPLPAPQQSVLAVGGELKSAVCLTSGERAFLSQHIGDLKNSATQRSLEETVAHLAQILDIQPVAVAHDLHPDYLSTGFAGEIEGVPRIAVQHHHAHLASCMAENRLEGEVIGVIFDGAGFGLDGKIWGGEFLLGGYRAFERRGHFRYVPMPGGDAAAREPLRMAIAYLYDLCGEELFDLPLPSLSEVPDLERKLFLKMLSRRINTPLTSSCGRLFDAVAALIGVRSRNSYEGQAAIELEGVAQRGESPWNYPFGIAAEEGRLVADFRPMIAALVRDIAAGEAASVMARRFHDAVAAVTAEVCDRIRLESGVERVVLSGGVFQNKMLAERVHDLMTARGFQVFTHRLVPPNDGGLALGQAVIAGHALR